MKIKKIVLNNFRQFYGEQSIEISSDRDKNVTLIHAQNGAGKTTILNSIMWAFYNKTTKKFNSPNDIINYQAYKEGAKSASVSILFEHDSTYYYARRWHQVEGSQRIAHTFRVYHVDDGNYKQLTAPEEFINSVMPHGMAPYFFFDGEHAETFGAEHNNKQVNRAIRNILGCNLAENAISDLAEIQKQLRREIGATPGADALAEANQRLEQLEQQRQDAENNLNTYQNDQQAHEQAAVQLRRELEQYRESAEKQKRRNEKQERLRKVQQARRRAEQNRMAWPGQHGLPLVVSQLVDDVLNYVDEESLKGRIPSPYNENFVQDLLAREECVCGRSLPRDSHEWRNVYGLLESAGSAQTQDRVTRAKAEARSLQRQTKGSVTALNDIERALAEADAEEQRLEQEIADLSKEIADLPEEEIKEKERSLQEAERKAREIERQIGGLQNQIDTLKEEYRKAESEYNRIAQQNVKVAPLIARKELAESLENFLTERLESHETSARSVIKDKVAAILEKTTRRNYKFWLGADFQMELLYTDNRPVPRSGGENQLMSLAFISALVSFARMRANAQGDILIPGLVGPLVLDSPFGQLDDVYRKATAEFVPDLAEQVVVLVSRGQGDESVLDGLEGRVGLEYVLVQENAGDRGEKMEESVSLNGVTYPLSQFNCERDQTRVVSVNL